MRHLVIRATQLEAEHRLQVLALQQNLALEAVAQVNGVGEWRLLHDLIDARGEDEPQVLRETVRSSMTERSPAAGFVSGREYIWVTIGQKEGLWDGGLSLCFDAFRRR